MTQLPQGSSILDLGPGNGHALDTFRSLSLVPTGVSISASEAKVLREEKGHNIILGDMHFLKVRENHFNAVWARHVMEHSIMPFYLLHVIHQALSPGGYLYIEVPLANSYFQHEDNPNHYSVLSERGWEALVKRSQFDLITSSYIDWDYTAPAIEGVQKERYFMIWVLFSLRTSLSPPYTPFLSSIYPHTLSSVFIIMQKSITCVISITEIGTFF
jgi:SAM-dependent methyltransferase